MAVLAALFTAGCGGAHRGPHVGKDDVAVVGTVQISKASYDSLLASGQATLGKSASADKSLAAALASAVMARLVADAEQANLAQSRGITVSALRARITARVHVTAADDATFVGFLGDGPPQAREVRDIVLYDPAPAKALYAELSVGSDATWCAAAKRSLEHGPGSRCGTALITNGLLVQPLGRLAFSTARNHTLLVHDQQGYWTILEPLSQTYSGGLRSQVKALLLLQAQTVALGRWEATIARPYCTGVNVAYRRGFEPDPDPTRCVVTTFTKTVTTR